MEKSIQDIIDYVLKTPENTNPTILRQQLENLSIKRPIKKGFITFYDYDGTILYSWSKEETEAAAELPPLPTQKGLICQGWNWSLADIKAMGSEVNVGAMYTTDDGDTRVYITLSEGRTSPTMGLGVNGTVTVDWGDGTTPDTLTGTSVSTTKWTPTHNYALPGDYVIRITPEGGTVLHITGNNFGAYLLRYSAADDYRSRAYNNSISKMEIGNGVTSIGEYAFNYCLSLSSITIPNGVTSIGSNAFYRCYSLSIITIPDGVTSIGEYAFNYCYSLSSITIPDGVTSISEYAFSDCYSLSSITIPNSVTSIGNSAFDSCYSLSSITIPNGVTSIGSNAFSDCYSLSSITIPDGVTSIGEYAFSDCYSLSSITIPDGVTSIGEYAFSDCYSLSSITIPDGVTSIGVYAFSDCYSLAIMRFIPTTPPAVVSSSTFNNIPEDCVVEVPVGCLEAYQNATNYSGIASQMVEIQN